METGTKAFLKRISHHTWQPAVKYYLRRPRRFQYEDISLVVAPGVFHPGFFFSTRQLLSYLPRSEWKGKRVLEMGCGTALLSIYCAKRGALTTACDISKAAVECARANVKANQVQVAVKVSDLFSALQENEFDVILCNPPFYRGTPQDAAAHAWYAGDDFQYFRKFFSEAPKHLAAEGKILMVLSSDGDRASVLAIAAACGGRVTLVDRHRNFWEEGFIYSIAF